MLKLVWKEMRRSWLFHLLLLIQLIAVFLVMISMVSTIISRYHYYQPMRQLLNTNGNYYNLDYVNNPRNEGHMISGDKELEAALPQGTDIYASNQISVRCKEIPTMVQGYSYNQKLIDLYQPQMKEGIWLDQVKEVDSNMIPAVIGCNNTGIKIGDVLEIENGMIDKDKEQPHFNVKVVGIIAENEKMLLSSPSFNHDYRDVYLSSENDAGHTPVLYLRHTDFEKYGDYMFYFLSRDLFVSYPNSMTNDDISKSRETLRKYAQYKSSMELSELKEGSLAYIAEQVYTLLPIAAGVLILTLTGAMSINAISIKKQLRNFSIYYICGLQWKKCIRINALLLAIQVSVAAIISIFAIGIGQWLGLLGDTVIQIGGWQILCCLVIGCFYIGLSLLLPLQILKNTTPNEVLKTN